MLTGMTTIQDGYIGSYQARLRGWDVATAYLTFLDMLLLDVLLLDGKGAACCFHSCNAECLIEYSIVCT